MGEKESTSSKPNRQARVDSSMVKSTIKYIKVVKSVVQSEIVTEIPKIFSEIRHVLVTCIV